MNTTFIGPRNNHRNRKGEQVICDICGKNEVGAVEDSDRDFCALCWFTGRVFERSLSSDERANLLTRIRELPNVTGADVWHYMQSMFCLNIMTKDGRLLTPGAPADAILGQQFVVPFIPPAGDEWAVLVTRLAPGENGSWENAGGQAPTLLPDRVDDDGLVRLIEEIS